MAFFKFRKGGDPAAARATAPLDSVEAMRRRAKHRLLGTAVLVLVAVIGFPILFETQPRPVAVDIPIEVPDRNKVKPLVMPSGAPQSAASASASGQVAVEGAVKPSGAASAAAAKAAVVAPAASIGQKEEIIGDKPAAKAAATAEAKADDGTKAKALLEGKEPDKTVAGEARFVVQVGAFADADKARDVRQKLERAGLKTYAQVVETKDGARTRVRVGPFASRSQADEVAGRVKAIDLPAAVLAL
jgi:DedD protein